MSVKPFVFSIRPCFLDMFRAGTKRRSMKSGAHVEFRTRRPSVKTSERHLIYETAPVSKVVAIATIGEIIVGTPDEVWALTTGDGILRKDFDEYFDGRTRAVAIEMAMDWLDTPVALPDGMAPPQSWSRWKGAWPLEE